MPSPGARWGSARAAAAYDTTKQRAWSDRLVLVSLLVVCTMISRPNSYTYHIYCYILLQTHIYKKIDICIGRNIWCQKVAWFILAYFSSHLLYDVAKNYCLISMVALGWECFPGAEQGKDFGAVCNAELTTEIVHPYLNIFSAIISHYHYWIAQQ